MKHHHKPIHHVSLGIPLVIIFLMIVALSLLHTQVRNLFSSQNLEAKASSTTEK